MTTKINLVLSLTLNVMLGGVILVNNFNNKKPVSLGDLRDSVADTRAVYQPPVAAPAEVLPPPVVETALVLAPPAAAAVEEPAPRRAVVVANDWAAYKEEMADDRDVVVSNVFHSKKNSEKAMNAAVRGLLASGKDVLFSCLMPATDGGTFYLIRLVSATPEIPRVAAMGDRSGKYHVRSIKTDGTEEEAWGSI